MCPSAVSLADLDCAALALDHQLPPQPPAPLDVDGSFQRMETACLKGAAGVDFAASPPHSAVDSVLDAVFHFRERHNLVFRLRRRRAAAAYDHEQVFTFENALR